MLKLGSEESATRGPIKILIMYLDTNFTDAVADRTQVNQKQTR